MKINITNTEKIQAALDGIQHRCTERCYDARCLQGIAADFIETMGDLGVSRSKLNGCSITFGGNYNPAKAYKYIMMGTIGTITFTASAAFLTSLERTCCERSTGATLTEAAKEAIIKMAEKQSY